VKKRAAELDIAKKELKLQKNNKAKLIADLNRANQELTLQHDEKVKLSVELDSVNKELSILNDEKEKRLAELIIAKREQIFQNDEKAKRAAELVIANEELSLQNEENTYLSLNLANYDVLTKLPNRYLLMNRLNKALAASSRSGKRGAIFFLDLDHFKDLNDSLGHDIGDLLLQQVAERLISCIREEDTRGG